MNWTQEIDDYIRGYYESKSDNEIARYLNTKVNERFSARDISNRRRQLKLVRTRLKDSRSGLDVKIIKVCGKRFRVGSGWLGEYYIYVLMRAPFLVVSGKTSDEAYNNIRKVLMNEFSLKSKYKELNKETVDEIRRLYQKGWSQARLDRRFKCATWKITQNKVWVDPNYVVPDRESVHKGVQVEIYGESKNLSEWARDPRCEVAVATLYERYEKGVRGKDLLTLRLR